MASQAFLLLQFPAVRNVVVLFRAIRSRIQTQEDQVKILTYQTVQNSKNIFCQKFRIGWQIGKRRYSLAQNSLIDVTVSVEEKETDFARRNICSTVPFGEGFVML